MPLLHHVFAFVSIVPLTARHVPLPSASAAAALLEDDACRAGQECALEALQTSKTSRMREATAPAQSEAPKREVPIPAADLPPWVIVDGENLTKPTGEVALAAEFGHMFAKLSVDSPACKEWTAWFWPQTAFWARQIGRRVAQVDYGDEENLKKVRKFARQAAYLVGVMPLDPRSGHEWSEPSAAFFRSVEADQGLDMPPLPAFFRRTTNRSPMIVSILNTLWFQALSCDLDWWQTELSKGQKPDPDICWTKVEHPAYGYSPGGMSLTLDQPAWPITFNASDRKEYLACQDIALNDTFFEAICPFGGHVKNLFGVATWGKGLPERGHESVRKCQAKLGDEGLVQQNISMFAMTFFDTEGVDLGIAIEDGPATPSNNSHPTDTLVFLKYLLGLQAAYNK